MNQSLIDNKIVDDVEGLGDALALVGDLKVAYEGKSITVGEVLAPPVTHASPPLVTYVAEGNAGKKVHCLYICMHTIMTASVHVFVQKI